LTLNCATTPTPLTIPNPIQTGALALRLLRERDANDGYALLGIARVLERRSDGQLVLDRAYLAPQSRIEASGQLSAVAGLLHGLIQQRGRQLAARMGQLGHGLSEVGDFLMLQTLNRAEPLFRQFAGAPSVHPWTFYLGCLQLAGDLATFSGNRRHPPEYPLYRHDDLQRVFAPVVEDLRNLLSTELQRHAVQIELIDRNARRAHGRHCTTHDLLRTASVSCWRCSAQLPAEQLRQRFPAQSKLGPVPIEFVIW
jgi:type VI secretion system protein ImpJ